MEGIASWYGEDFNGHLTSSGEVYDMYEYTAAHKTLPLGTVVRVINQENGMSTQVRINDRGPFVKERIIDLSRTAARVLATGEKHSVREFVEKAFAHISRPIEWSGSGMDEKEIDARSGGILIEVNSRYFRPTEVDLLVGDAAKARERLGWRHEKNQF